MAVRVPHHVHEGGVVERRLRPIYDWLDNGNNKKALQEAEKVLKKSPSLQSARALKALALLRLGKSQESHSVLNALAEEKPSDDTTLQAMTISYRESQQLHKVCEIYEAAVKAEPTNEELFSHLFMSYVRVGDPKSQQRVAMALYKFVPKNPYYFWAVMSIVLQAQTEENSTKKSILLTLSQRMLDNFISEGKMEAEQEVRLYIMILEMQNKWDEILTFIEGPLYRKIIPGNNGPACIPYMKKLGHWRKLNLLCKDLLWENQDRWDYYMPYFDSVFELANTESDCEDNADSTFEKCHEFICQLVESVSSGKILRGPYLARLELWKRLSKQGDANSLLGSGMALCEQYLRVFGHKPCVVPDLRPYLPMIPQEERERNCKTFLTCLGCDEHSKPDKVDDIQRHISCITIWRLCDAPMSSGAAVSTARSLADNYLRCLQQGLVTATLTEFCAADGYGLLAAHYYLHAAILQCDYSLIYEALCLLELVLHNSPANFHVKLLLITLYHYIGNGIAADSIYLKLDVKHIQLLSLGWVHAERLEPACAAPRALQLLADTVAFHTHHGKDSMEQLTHAYKYGTFEKLVELQAWRRRVDACAWGAAAARRRALTALLAGPPAPPSPPPPLPTTPTDNRDLDVVVDYEAISSKDPNRRQRMYEQDIAYLHIKDLLLKTVILCVKLANVRQPEEKDQQKRKLLDCLGELGTCMDRCTNEYRVKHVVTTSALFPPRIIALVNSQVPYRELYPCCVLAAAGLSSSDEAARAVSMLRESRGAVRGGEGDVREVLEELANYLEFIGIITYIIGLNHEVEAQTNSKKSKRKTNTTVEEASTAKSLGQLSLEIQDAISTVEGIFDSLSPYEGFDASLEEKFAKINLSSDYRCPVEQKIKNGFRDMVADMKNILQKKTKYLKSLVF